MTLIKWTPSLFEQLNDMDEMFKEFSPLSPTVSSAYPALDIYQDDKYVYVEAQLAGVDPANVSVSIENDILTIAGTVERKTEVDEQHYYRKEIRSGGFKRSVALPASVASDKAEAEFENGVLTVTTPKHAAKQKNTIAIKVSKNTKQ